jgi:hypothetical protein
MMKVLANIQRNAAQMAVAKGALLPQRSVMHRNKRTRQTWETTATAALNEEAAAARTSEAATDPSSSGTRSPLAAGMAQRLFAAVETSDTQLLLLAVALGSAVALDAVLPAAAAAAEAASSSAAHHPMMIGDLAENEEFWSNVLRYISYFFSVLLGTAYVALRPILELLKKPGTAVFVVIGTVLLVGFVTITVQGMLGVSEYDYAPSSIVTPVL